MEETRHDLIYGVYRAHIEFGFFPKGASLPAISQHREMYHSNVNTVRKAYLRLQKDGYVSVSQGRGTTVVYGLPAGQYRRNIQEFYLARMAAKRPLGEALHAFLIPLLREGAGRLEAPALRKIGEVTASMDAGRFYVAYFCGREMLLALQNRLALDLFNAVISYYQWPHVLIDRLCEEADVRAFRALSSQIISACGRENREALADTYIRLLRFVYGALQSYMERFGQTCPAQEQIPFTWDMYRERPQRCYSVAADLLDRIDIQEEFVSGDFLPSHGTLAQEYAVSVITIRRAEKLLESLGAIRSSQGLGAWVAVPGAASVDPRDRSVRQIGGAFVQAAQMLSISLEGIVAFCDPALGSVRASCLERLRTLRRAGGGFRCLAVFLDCLLRGTGNPAAGEIWGKLYESLLLGLPLLEARAAARPGVRSGAAACAGALIRSLEAGDRAAVQACLSEGIDIMTSVAKTFLQETTELGVREDDTDKSAG